MNKYTFTTHAPDAPMTLVRVSKQAARKLFDAGVEIAMCPAKLSPVAFAGAFRYHPTTPTGGATFDQVVASFKSYNCNSNETGNYVSFWQVKR